MFNILIIILLIICIARQAFFLISIRKSSMFLKNMCKDDENYQIHNKFIILIPVLKEEELILDTVIYFDKLRQYYKDKVTIVFITTQREYSGYNHNDMLFPNTINLLQCVSTANKFKCIHYPFCNGLKSDQINFCVEFIENEIQSKSFIAPDGNTFYIIYDADSRPSFNSLYAFESAINKFPNHNIFQQVSWFSSTCKRKGWLINNYIYASALRANRYVLSTELSNLVGRLKYSQGHRHIHDIVSKLSYSHVTGHGLCIRSAYLKRNQLPSNTILEDMYYGFKLNCENETVVPVKSMDYATVPSSFSETFIQSSKWFLGPARGIYYLFSQKKQKSIYAWVITLSTIFISLEWMLCSLFPFLPGICQIYFSVTVLILVSFFIIIYYATWIYSFDISKKHGMLYPGTALMMVPVINFFFGISSVFGLGRYFYNRPKFSNRKTERT